MKIFTGNSNPALAKSISNSLGKNLGNVEIKKFSDGELSIVFLDNLRNEDVYIIRRNNNE